MVNYTSDGRPETQQQWYDYDNQAWVVGDHYAECGHLKKRISGRRCCFAGEHAGRPVSDFLSAERIAELRSMGRSR